MTPGSVTIYLAAACGITAFISAILWTRGNEKAAGTLRVAYHGMTAALGLACVFLMLAIVNHDYSYEYVVNYSSNDLPMLYLVSAFWGGQEGTFLLWAFMAALIGYPLFRKTSWEPAAVMACYMPTILFLIGLMVDPGGNPFKTVAEVPPDGHGLNPLLQDPWMASHPPAVFLGYAAMTVPAVLAMVALVKRDESSWLRVGIRWSLIGFISLGLGIIMGGFWAYKVLGWGGYWGWDPVENASLIPWIVVTGLLHGLVTQRSSGALRRTNLVLALACYLLVIYATFLTRSGILADFSVHSFPVGTLFRWLLVGMLLFLLVAAIAVVRRGSIAADRIEFNAGRQFLASATVVLLALSAVLVLFGTSWPIISSMFDKPAVPEAPFYNRVNMPLYIMMLLALGIMPFSGWKVTSAGQWKNRIYLAAGLAVVGTVAGFALGGRGWHFLLMLAVSCFAFFGSLLHLVKAAGKGLLRIGGPLAHLGFSLMFIGVVASSAWDTQAEGALPLGHPVEVMDRLMTYRGHVEGSQPEDKWRVAVMKPGEPEREALTTMYRTGGRRNDIMRKPAIVRSLLYDLYIAPIGLETNEKFLHLALDEPKKFGPATVTFLGFDTSGMGDHQAEMRVAAVLRIETGEDGKEEVALPMTVHGGRTHSDPVEPQSLPGTTLILEGMSVEQKMVHVAAMSDGVSQTLIVEASVKPLMNLLWAGTILLLAGCVVAAARRYLEKRTAS